jgi:hypothetical protein
MLPLRCHGIVPAHRAKLRFSFQFFFFFFFHYSVTLYVALNGRVMNDELQGSDCGLFEGLRNTTVNLNAGRN